ncbi:MAG: butyrate kinase [Spirochaetales bacterium]|nr:butyrate kinase [Spirochaetales bacterium]
MLKEGILAINPGSTSTKLALFDGEKEILKTSLEHSRETMSLPAQDQLSLRENAVRRFLEESGHPLSELQIIAARGGLLPPINGGAYRIDRAMTEYLARGEGGEHASNLAAQIAYNLAGEVEPPLTPLIYDGVTLDQMDQLARYSGSARFTRESLCHGLNMRAVARATAAELNRPYEDLNLIVAHLGGGVTISLHSGGRIIDTIADDEGPMSPERAGRLPCLKLIRACFSGKYEQREMERMIRGEGGLKSYLGTTDIREILERIDSGDKYAEEVLDSMILQIAKGIGELSVETKGRINRIILTGGMARALRITTGITERVEFIAPVKILPGEFEMEALAAGGLRILRKEESLQTLTIPTPSPIG